ncbi:hypothetical protein ACHQM5_017608 [Ranunculus cassubicifolius]
MEVGKALSFGSSVPPKYIRSDQHTSVVSDSAIIPIIDLKRFLLGSLEELEKLDSACKHWGFFQVVNHGVGSSLVEKLKHEIHDFFNLSFEEKKQLWQQPGDLQGCGQLFVVSEEQKLDWADMFFIRTLPIKHNLFAKIPLPLRDTLESYSKELKKLAILILDKMAESLNIDGKEMEDLFNDGGQTPEQVIGLTPHSDNSALTILLQLNETEGLQIRKDGKWIPVKPSPDSFVVNIGNIMEIVSNGVYRSIEHRVMVNSSKERLSVATFYTPKLDAKIGPASSLISADNPAMFRTLPPEKYYKDFFARKLDGKSYLDSIRI